MKHMMICLFVTLISAAAVAQEAFIYPKKGQSAEQQDKDKYECYNWAKGNTGFDPMAPPTVSSAPPSNQRKSGGLVKGAVVGATVGAIAGGNSRSTRRGAATGAFIGGMRQSSRNRQAEQQRKQWEQEEAAKYANKRDTYNRAYAACLEGRNYTVK